MLNNVIDLINFNSKPIRLRSNNLNEFSGIASKARMRDFKKNLSKIIIEQILNEENSAILFDENKSKLRYFETNFEMLNGNILASKLVLPYRISERGVSKEFISVKIGRGIEETLNEVRKNFSQKNNRLYEIVDIYYIDKEDRILFVFDDSVKYFDMNLLEEVIEGYLNFLDKNIQLYLIDSIKGENIIKEFYFFLITRKKENKELYIPLFLIFDNVNNIQIVTNPKNIFIPKKGVYPDIGVEYDLYKEKLYIRYYFHYLSEDGDKLGFAITLEDELNKHPIRNKNPKFEINSLEVV